MPRGAMTMPSGHSRPGPGSHPVEIAVDTGEGAARRVGGSGCIAIARRIAPLTVAGDPHSPDPGPTRFTKNGKGLVDPVGDRIANDLAVLDQGRLGRRVAFARQVIEGSAGVGRAEAKDRLVDRIGAAQVGDGGGGGLLIGRRGDGLERRVIAREHELHGVRHGIAELAVEEREGRRIHGGVESACDAARGGQDRVGRGRLREGRGAAGGADLHRPAVERGRAVDRDEIARPLGATSTA